MEEKAAVECRWLACMTRQGVLLSGLERVLKATPWMVCDLPLFTDPESWFAAAATARPTVVLVDMLSKVPHTAIHELRRRLPDARVLFWVVEADLTAARQALEMGARGLLKSDTSDMILLRCLDRVSEGELWFDRQITLGLMHSTSIQLSRREYQLMVLVCNGLSNKEIAEALALAEGTIKFYLSRLFRKCGVADRLELALFGLRHFFEQTPEVGDPIDLGVPTAARRVLIDQPPERRRYAR